MAIKKKKKKEEFDTSLMGGYLPGVRTPVSVSAVMGPSKIYQGPAFLQSNFRYIPRWGEGDVYDPMPYQYEEGYWGGALRAWNEYAFGSGPTQLAIQTPQAYLLYKGGFYSTFSTALFIEFAVATIVTATVLTILDPGHKWEGGFDETAAGKSFTEGFRSGWEAGPIPWKIPF